MRPYVIDSCFFYGFRLFGVVLLTLILANCSSKGDVKPVHIESTPGQDTAPVKERDVSLIADAIPEPVIRTKAGNTSPYTVFGETYTLLPDSQGYQEQGHASWYGTKFHGRYTANGEIYDMWGMTAAHKTLPIPSYVRVTNTDNDHSVIVKVNDRGPFHSDRIIDLSYAAAKKLGFADKGVALVNVVDITPENHVMSQKATSLPMASNQSSTVTVLPSKVGPDTPVSPIVTMPKAQPKKASNTAVLVSIDDMVLQVGAFKEKNRANKLKSQLSKLLTVPVTVESSTVWHRVRVGPIRDKQTLATTKQLLAEQGINNAREVK